MEGAGAKRGGGAGRRARATVAQPVHHPARTRCFADVSGCRECVVIVIMPSASGSLSNTRPSSHAGAAAAAAAAADALAEADALAFEPLEPAARDGASNLSAAGVGAGRSARRGGGSAQREACPPRASGGGCAARARTAGGHAPLSTALSPHTAGSPLLESVSDIAQARCQRHQRNS